MSKKVVVNERFEVQFSEEVRQFLTQLDAKAREKILYNIRKAQFTNDKELFKKLNDEIWEFRTLFNRAHYRIFAFWDKSEPLATLVLTTHGIIKKTDKTPQPDPDRADKIRKRYFQQKNQQP